MRAVLINFIDNIFVIFVSFLFNFLWSRYFFGLSAGFFVSLILTMILSLLFLFLKSSKQTKNVNKQKANNTIKQWKNYLLFENDKNVKNLLASKLNAVFVSENICEIKGEIFYVFPFILSPEKVLEIIKNNNAKVINIICPEKQKDVESLIHKLEEPKINILEPNDFVLKFDLNLENVDFAVKIKEENRLNFKSFLKLFVREENAKGYLIGAIVLMLSVLIIKQKIYYYFFISCLLILSVICKYKPKIVKLWKN